jgi:6-phosphogluconolactonase/glucosamine-6-phosphate isomerase/deaminase
MEFVNVEGTTDLEVELTNALNVALTTNKPVLWLVPGGSNISTAVSVMANIELENIQNLTIILSDERYGNPGHPDSNFFQLHQAGFSERGATFVDLLYGGSFEETVSVSNNAMQHIFTRAEIIIAFFGMGPDGHIAGILPNSPAAIGSESWMIGYEAGQYKRITLSPFALSHIQTAFVGAYGPEKLAALTTLRDQSVPIAQQPAQILRHLPFVKIFSDQLEGSP